VGHIGDGQAGGPLSMALARAGRRTAVIEREHAGGTCVKMDCTPTNQDPCQQWERQRAPERPPLPGVPQGGVFSRRGPGHARPGKVLAPLVERPDEVAADLRAVTDQSLAREVPGH
jgi:hypothetical protein